MSQFMFATGIENSNPTIQLPDGTTRRVDEMEKCGHYKRWKDDFQLVKDMGIQYLRYGPPLHTTHLGPGPLRLEFCRRNLQRTKTNADYAHRGSVSFRGSRIGSAISKIPTGRNCLRSTPAPLRSGFPGCGTTRRSMRFSLPRCFPRSTAGGTSACPATAISAAPSNICAGRTCLPCAPFWKCGRDAIFIQSESSEYFHPEHPDCLYQCKVLNEKRFLSLDLTYGYPLNVTMYEYLLDHGWTRDEYAWFGRTM